MSTARNTSAKSLLKRALGLVAMAHALLPGAAVAAPADNPHFRVLGTVVVWGADAASGVPVVSDMILNSGNGTTAATSGDTDLIAGNVHTVVTGTLMPTGDAINAAGTMPFVVTGTAQGNILTDSNGDGVMSGADAFSAFRILSGSDTRVDATATRSSFYIASNTPFSIDARALPATTSLGNTLLNIIRLNMRSTVTGNDGLAFGARAQAAHSGGPNAGFAPEYLLSQLTTPRRIFTGNRRTAAGRGTLAEQSIRFDAVYTIRAINLTGYDLSLGTFDFEVDMIYTVFVP